MLLLLLLAVANIVVSCYFLRQVSGVESSKRDRYLLRFHGDSSSSGSVCAVVAAYAGVCPFKDTEDSVRTADMWFTVLDRGTMTIR